MIGERLESVFDREIGARVTAVGPAMGSLVRGLVLLSLLAAASAASVEWHAVKEPEHHVAAAKLAKVPPRPLLPCYIPVKWRQVFCDQTRRMCLFMTRSL